MDSQSDFQRLDSQTVKPKTSGLAIVTFVLGLLSISYIFLGPLQVFWPILILFTILFFIIAVVKIKRSKGRLKGTALAKIGLSIPLVFAVLVPPRYAFYMLAAIPQTSNSINNIKRVVCGTNLRGLHTAIRVYVNDYDEKLPTENWCDLLIEEADVSPKSFICPTSDAIEGESTYGMNENVADKKLNELPANIVLLFETDKGLETGPRDTLIQTRRHHKLLDYKTKTKIYKDRFNQFGGPEDLLLRHNDNESGQRGCNIVFADGKVEFVTEERIDDLKWTVD